MKKKHILIAGIVIIGAGLYVKHTGEKNKDSKKILVGTGSVFFSAGVLVATFLLAKD